MITHTLAQQGMGGLPINQTLSTYSDYAYFTSFGLYVLGLVAALLYYGGYRAAKIPSAESRQLIGAGAGGEGPLLTESQSITDASEENTSSAWGGRWARLSYLFVAVGLVFHAASLVLRGVATERAPWGNMYEFISVSCALGIAFGLITLRKPALRVAWPYVLVPVLLLMFFGGTKLYSQAAPVVPALKSFWLPIHVSVVSVGCGIFLISGMASVMYLIRVWQPKGKERGFFAAVARPLPTADVLDRLAYSMAVIGFPLFGVGILLGAVWAETAWGRFWGWDPKETTSFVAWMLYAVYLHARATSGWGAKKAAWINIAGFSVFLFNLFFINIVISGLHSYAGLN